MTVSVCVPTHNSAKYLRECLESVLAQTFDDFELVIVDSASTDGTCDIISSYSDPRICLYRFDRNLGMSASFNQATQLARGKYIKLLCHDDLIDPDCLAKQTAMLEQHPALIMVTSGLSYVDAAGRTLRMVSRCPRETVLRDVDLVAGNLVYGNVIGSPSAVLIRRDCLLRAGPFSDQFPQAMDVDMWLRLAAIGPVGYIPEPLCRFRLHPQALTQELRKTGVIRNDVLRLTTTMLQSVSPTPWARRVAWGRVAGSFLKQALCGLGNGYIRWPLEAIWQALRMDPALAGLMVFQTLFRTGILGLTVSDGRGLKVRRGKTLHDRACVN